MSEANDILVRICRRGNAVLLVFFAFYFFLYPAAHVLLDLSDPNIRAAGIPQTAWSLHRSLSPKYQQWAEARLKSSRAAELSTENISGTEWPLFGSVFYLWATESLQDVWDKSHAEGSIAPKVYAKDAIAAATQLVIDPSQANWVKIHWGTNYLKTENVFYRMLVISALTSHTRLTGDKEYLPMLRDQADSLLAELDASKFGILDDYPSQCYPGDVLTAFAMIQRADQVLGTDHSATLARAMRGFQGQCLDKRGLVPYAAFAPEGVPIAPSRGCGNSYVSLFSPELWPDQSKKWYDLYSKYFWQEQWTCAGFREFPNDLPGNEWYMDVDAGPVLKGYGCAACAFGVGAARVNGHFEQAYPLTAEMLVTSWPLPDGTRLLPRLFSNAADAPYLGEAGLLFNLTRLPTPGFPIKTGGSIPGFVWLTIAVMLAVGFLLLGNAVLAIRRDGKTSEPLNVPAPQFQCAMWLGLTVAGLVCFVCGKLSLMFLLLLLAQLFLRRRRLRQKVVAP